MATRDQIEKLKKGWTSDPCWDIETTEGFEDHEDELRAFAAEKEAEWSEQGRQRLSKLAEDLGCPGNLELAMHFEALKLRIEQLEKREFGNREIF